MKLNRDGLNGTIPAELGNLANLRELFIWSDLTGEIPAELGNLAKLRGIAISYNRLTGEIPSELGNLAKLESLFLDDNYLTGEIPSELGNLAKLEFLDLRDNRLTGTIPSWLGNLAMLRELSLSGNQLTGCIPQVLRASLSAVVNHIIRGEIERLGLPFCGETTAATPTPTATSAPRATATATPTSTSTPRPSATPVATPTPTATSAASNEVMSRLVALERQVGEIPELRRQIAAMGTRIARLEDGSGAGAATATPSPTPTATATPASAIEASPTPTATPSPTATSVAGVSGGDACITALAGNASVRGRWTSDCVSANSPNNRTYYARFYTFALDAAAEAKITLSSNEAAPYLFLREGEWMGGAVRRETGVANANAATMTIILSAGSYTIEASTWEAETAGDFTLELEIAR